MFATAPISRGQYVCEYKTTEFYRREKRAENELQYVLNEEPCMVFEVQTAQGWFCLDATRRFHTPGRLMNHAPAQLANVKPFKALLVNGKWRVAFPAVHDIQVGEELTWDYGCPPEGQKWLMRVRRKPASGRQGMYLDSFQIKDPPLHCV